MIDLIQIQVCQVFDKINLTCSLSASVIDKRVPYTFYAKHAWAIFFLVDRDLIFSLFMNRDSSTWLLHLLSMFRTNSALRSNLSKLRCWFPGRAFHLPLFWILKIVCSKSSWFKPGKTWLVDRYMQISVEKQSTRTTATMLLAQFHVKTYNFYSLRNHYNVYRVRCLCLC